MARTRGDVWDDVERAAKRECGDGVLCAECGCTFDTFTERCPRVDTDEGHSACEGWARIERAYDHAEEQLPVADRWAV